MKNIAIVYHYFAHYRLPILSKMANDKEINFLFISDIVSGNDIKVIDFTKEHGFEGKHFPVKNVWFKKILWQSGLLKVLLTNRFDSVMFLGEDRTVSTWVAIILLRLLNKKVYLWSHGLYGRESFFKKKIRVLFNKMANGIFLYNNRAKELLIQQNINEDKLKVIYNSLDFDETEKYRKLFDDEQKAEITSLFRNSAAPIVFCISRINASKRIDLLIEAIAHLKTQDFLLNCFIIGDGTEEITRLQHLVHENRLNDHVIFVGGLYCEKDISTYILSSDLCVCPASIGLTAIHSLSYGVPVITHNNFAFHGPEFESIVPGISGDFYNEGDILDLSFKIKDCINLRRENIPQSISNCLNIVASYYNPGYQMKIFKENLK